jgi:hypothetical protein
VLLALLKTTLPVGDECHLTVYAAAPWVCVWPRPASAGGGAAATLVLSRSGVVDYNGLRLAALPGSAFDTWSKELDKVASGASTLQIEDFFLKTNNNKALLPLVGQLTWLLAARIEANMAMIATDKAAKSAIADFTWELSHGLKGVQADAFCAKYLYGSQMAMGKHRVYFIATDKGQACGLPLQATLISAGKMLVMAPPVVDSDGDAAPSACSIGVPL